MFQIFDGSCTAFESDSGPQVAELCAFAAPNLVTRDWVSRSLRS